jgi:hypothetical protein
MSLKIVGICNALVDSFYMYWRQLEVRLLGLALKLGLNPVAIAHLSTDAGREYTNVLDTFSLCYMCVLWTRGTISTWSCFKRILSSIV